MSERYYMCHCCGEGFDSSKPQDPERDVGYGTCEKCAPYVAPSWVKSAFPGEGSANPIKTLEDAYARLAKYA